ncbi:hypothetical protein [Protofrankia symbiont of Coriaria ruscifolia]|uniref:hypothetical protein n=1 Tax=Protofrankia symbiont of Coriaria ruscifolia TaxID=1306542 RepID=UPI00104120FB|nr:hypothetical protein [Protofrankia symbiont of Coriaria ruscifolia]
MNSDAGTGGRDVDALLDHAWSDVETADLSNATDPFDEDAWGDPKSNAGFRPISLDSRTVAVLLAWRATQNAERLASGPAWVDYGRVFTHEDGRRLNPNGGGLKRSVRQLW